MWVGLGARNNASQAASLFIDIDAILIEYGTLELGRRRVPRFMEGSAQE